MVKKINRKELATLLLPAPKQKIHLIEITSGETYERAHLPQAIHLSFDELEDWIERELPDQSETVILYSEAAPGNQAYHAAEFLEAMGFSDVRYYSEGKDDWLLAGLPTESFYYRSEKDIQTPRPFPIDSRFKKNSGPK
jgi:rhodanese-related sulfurtransferase